MSQPRPDQDPRPRSPSSRGITTLASALVVSSLAGAIAAACSSGPGTGTGTTGGGHGGGTASGSTGATTSTSGSGGGTTTSTTSTSGSGGAAASTSGSGGAPCAQGTILCSGTTEQICDGMGGFTSTQDCAPQVCAPGLGCAVCVPGTGQCSGTTSMRCAADGTGFVKTDCDPDQGLTCDATSGFCVGACAPQILANSNIGCDYYPTVTANVVSSSPFHFAVSISNTTTSPANIKITQGASTIQSSVVAPGSVAVINLPWVSALKDSFSATSLVASGAYRLRSDQPVSVYQYSPLEYTLSGQFSYTNDASILLPVNAWTGNYRVVAWPSNSGTPGLYAITASQDATTVTVAPPTTGGSASPGAGVDGNGNGTVQLNAGDVLQVFSGTASAGDLTGSLIAADKPVQVIGGHVCTFVPAGVCCCDHLEESIPPLETVGTEYLVTAPLITGGTVPVNEVVRVVATKPNTVLTYDPPQSGAPTTIANAGDFVEIQNISTDFKLTGTFPVLVAQFMEGEQSVGSGDPAMTLAVPLKQYRKSYLFHAPLSYTANFVNVTALTGAVVSIDGAVVGGFVPIGGSGYSVARVPLSNTGTGTHTVASPSPVGISVYGYGEYTSYWYPGGQDLRHL